MEQFCQNGYNVKRIVSILGTEGQLKNFEVHLYEVTTDLKTPVELTIQIKKDLKAKKISLTDAVEKLIGDWIVRCLNTRRTTPKFMEFIGILKDNGLSASAELLEKEMKRADPTRQPFDGSHVLHFTAIHPGEIDFCITQIKQLIEHSPTYLLFERNLLDRTFFDELLRRPQMNPERFHRICTFIIEKKLPRLFDTVPNINPYFPPSFSERGSSLQLAVKIMEVQDATLELLRDGGVDFNAKDSFGSNLLFDAILVRRSTNLIKKLTEMGADWKCVNVFNQSVLHLAASKGKGKVLRHFLGLGGLDVNWKDDAGDTPLHEVVRHGRPEILLKIVKLLVVKYKADVTKENVAGDTPYMIYEKRYEFPVDFIEVEKLLMY